VCVYMRVRAGAGVCERRVGDNLSKLVGYFGGLVLRTQYAK